MASFHKLTINKIQKETDNAVSIVFDVPEHLKDEYLFKAGQYITLKTIINDKEIRRDYSICSSVGSGQLKVAVKAVENGTFSNYANTTLKAGDIIEVGLPNGRFILETNPKLTRNIVCFAAGSGITPIMSITKTLLENEPFSNMVLVYGNKSKEDAMFFNELSLLKTTYQNRLHIHYVYSQTYEENARFGRIDKSIVNLFVKNKYKEVTVNDFYLCGPEAMINVVKETLIENAISENKIHFELFTSTALSPENTITAEGESEITVLVDDEETSFTMSKDLTILEAALKQNIDAPYSCQGGICSSCIARLTEGEATMRQNNILTEGELAEGLILTCQAQPTTAKVNVDYDNV